MTIAILCYLAIAAAFAAWLLWLEPPRGLYVLQYFAAAVFGCVWPVVLAVRVAEWVRHAR